MSEEIVIVSTPPTPNGPLHLGHLSGPYVAGDIAARAAAADGARVMRVCGVDPNQNYVPVRARQLGESVGEVLDRYGRRIREALSLARVPYDVFTDPSDQPDYRRAVVDLLQELIDAKAVVVDDAEFAVCEPCDRTMHHAYVTGRCPGCGQGANGGTCEGCGGFTTAANLLEPSCTQCGGRPRAVRMRVPVLRLEDYREQLYAFWSHTVLSSRVTGLIRWYLTTSLPDVPLAYPTDWGLDLPDRPEERLDVWAEMGLGHIYSIANGGVTGPAHDMDAYAAAWRKIGEVWFFCGIDNAFYNAIMFPALFAAAGMPIGPVRGLVVNEFYRLDGSKFSTSRDHAIWAHEFLAEQDPAAVRLYLCWDRPDTYESDFSLAAFESFAARVRPLLATGSWPGGRDRARPGSALRLHTALRPSTFDPALAVRCLLEDPEADARSYLGHLTGQEAG